MNFFYIHKLKEGVILHELFFENMGPAVPTSPNTKLMEQIIKDLGNLGMVLKIARKSAKIVT